jgi:predicted transcriptional regulator of viral defense system/very-short-patch-repair endonuclease
VPVAALNGRAREAAMATLAARQHGVVARWQLLELGLTARAIAYRLSVGRLHVVHRGVYAVGHRRITVRGRWMAAVLTCGRKAALSHRSAAALWGFLDVAGPRVDVTAPDQSGAVNRRIRHHRVRRLPPEDATKLDAIPVTTVARTLFDLAEILDRSALERAFEAAERAELLDLTAIELTMERNPGRRAHKPLSALLPSLSPAEPTRSELERLFHRLCLLAGLLPPQVNVLVEGFEVDAFWPAHRFVVELDSFEFHKTRAAFERDRARDAALSVAGYRVVRITYRQLRDRPEGVAETVRSLLAVAA